MSAQTRLILRNRTWTFRAKVPEKLRPIVGKRELWKSFAGLSYSEAVRLARIESVAADALFAQALNKLNEGSVGSTGRNAASPSDRALADLARSYLHKLETEATPPIFGLTEHELRERGEAIAEEIGHVAASLEDAHLQRSARDAAADAKISILDGHDLYRVTDAVQRAIVEHLNREADRAFRRSETHTDPLFINVTRAGPAPAASLTLSKSVDAYMNDVERQHLAPRTKASYRAKLGVMVALIGDRPVNEINRAHVREARDLLVKLPAHHSKKWPGKGMRDVAALAERKGIAPMSAKSALLHVEVMSTLFKWLCTEELALKNPAVGLRGPELPEQTGRRPFRVDELNVLFASAAFNGGSRVRRRALRTSAQGRECQPVTTPDGSRAVAGRGWRFWMPRLALFSGARFSELIGLKASDVIEIDNVPCLSFEANELRDLKTRGSKRVVPIHRKLVELGFLNHAGAIPQDGLLFPDVIGPKDFITARNKQIGAAIRTVVADKGAVFHSFRHTFKDAADAVMPRDMVARLGGWDMPGGRTAMDGYGRGKLVRLLSEAMDKVEFPNLVIEPGCTQNAQA